MALLECERRSLIPWPKLRVQLHHSIDNSSLAALYIWPGSTLRFDITPLLWGPLLILDLAQSKPLSTSLRQFTAASSLLQ